MGTKNDRSGKYKESDDKSLTCKSLKMQKQEYDKFFKDICKLVKNFNKAKEKLEKVLK